MIKSELIERIAEQNPHLYQRDVEAIVNAILDTITTALARGDRVELRGFGVFAVKKRDARTGRNPRNGTKVAVPEKIVPTFKTSRDMHRRLNPSEARGSAASAPHRSGLGLSFARRRARSRTVFASIRSASACGEEHSSKRGVCVCPAEHRHCAGYPRWPRLRRLRCTL